MCDKSKLLCNFAQIFKEIVMRKRFIHILWAVFGTGILTVILAFVAIWFGMIGYMPDIEDLQNPINRFATQVYSADGKVLGTWNLNKENRIVIPYKKMSPYLIKALVATEDERFYEHSGIDFRALGRAIVKKAKVFLMDEPLSNLDAKLRVQMRSEIIKLHNSLNATTIYVTHDQTEAMTMATRIVVMNRGRVQQIGTPLEIYSHPANTFVASFIGSPAMNFLNVIYENGTVEFANGLRMTLPEDKKNAVEAYYAGIVDTLRRELAEFDDAFIERKEALSRIEKLKDDPEKQDLLEKEREQLRLIEESSADRMALIDSIEKLSAPGQSERREMIFGIRPEDIYEEEKAPDGEPLSAPYHTKVMLAELLGKEYYIHTEFAGSEIVSEIHTKKLVSAGDDINLVFDMESVHLFDPITTKAV